jgi:hypothetical protein
MAGSRLGAAGGRTRNAYRAVRAGAPPTAGVAAPGDPVVADLVATPFASVDDAHERLTGLEAHFRDRGTRVGRSSSSTPA